MRGLHSVARRVGRWRGELREHLIFFATLRRLGLPAALALLVGLLLVPASPTVAEDATVGAVVGTVRLDGPGTSESRPGRNVEVRLSFGTKSLTRVTGDGGTYRFAELVAGKYVVKVVAPVGYRIAGDETVGVTVGSTKRDVVVDFKLISVAPAPGRAVSPVVVPGTSLVGSATPATVVQGAASAGSAVQGGVVQGAASPGSAVQGSASPVPLPPSALPQSAIIRTSPVPILSASPVPSGAPARNESALALTTPPLIRVPAATPVAAVSRTPIPAASPRAIPPLPRIEDARANLPPRRLVTSFAALREGAGEASAGQLRTYATDSSLILGVPFITQIDGTAYSLVNCGPASLAMILSAYGLGVDPSDVRDYLNYLIGNYNTELGTSLDHLGRIAREAGLSTLGLYGRGGYRPWTVEDIREYVRAGYPIITLTKYRKLPGHLGSQTDFDHYVVITGLAGDDFVYNDAAYASEYGRNLLISPSELERAWGDSAIPRHAMAVGLGESVRPLPIVPRRLQPDAMAATAAREPAGARDLAGARELAGAVAAAEAGTRVEPPLRMVPGRATQNLRERLLDELGARSSIVGTDDEEDVSILHPTDVVPLDSRLGNIRIPAEALSEDESVARLVPPGALDEAVGSAVEDVASREMLDAPAFDTSSIDATELRAAIAPRTAAVERPRVLADQEDWGRRGAQTTGLLGLILFVAGWVGRQRRLASERRFAEQHDALIVARTEL